MMRMTRWLCGLVLLALTGLHFVSGADFSALPESQGEPLVEEAVLVFDRGARDASETTQVRVAYYNIEMFTDGIKDGQYRNETLALNQAKGAAAIIKDLHADILLISEVENARALTLLNDALEASSPAAYMVEFGTGGRRKEKMNIGLLTRYKPSAVHEVDFGPLTGAGRPTRGLFRVMFDLGDEHTLLVYATHLKSNWGSRRVNYAQRYHAMQLLRADMEHLEAEHPGRTWEKIILADFNSDPGQEQFAGDPTWQVLTNWHDLWSERPDVAAVFSIPTRFGDPRLEYPPALFDRVLAAPELRCAPWIVSLPSLVPRGSVTSDIKIKPGQEGHVSDHFPIFVDIARDELVQ